MAETRKKLLDQHEVDTVVISCIDFRFRDAFTAALSEAFGIADFDLISLAGGGKNISSPDKPGRMETVLDDIRLSVEAHHAKQIVVLTHQHCGKYAADGHVFNNTDKERSFHQSELKLASDVLFRQFPACKVVRGYIWVDAGDKVRIEEVKP